MNTTEAPGISNAMEAPPESLAEPVGTTLAHAVLGVAASHAGDGQPRGQQTPVARAKIRVGDKRVTDTLRELLEAGILEENTDISVGDKVLVALDEVVVRLAETETRRTHAPPAGAGLTLATDEYAPQVQNGQHVLSFEA